MADSIREKNGNELRRTLLTRPPGSPTRQEKGEEMPILSQGSHRTREEGTDILELISERQGLPHSMHPQSVSPLLRAYAWRLNDALEDDQRDAILPLADELPGTDCPLCQTKMAATMAELSLRVFAADQVRKAGQGEHEQHIHAMEAGTDLRAMAKAAEEAQRHIRLLSKEHEGSDREKFRRENAVRAAMHAASAANMAYGMLRSAEERGEGPDEKRTGGLGMDHVAREAFRAIDMEKDHIARTDPVPHLKVLREVIGVCEHLIHIRTEDVAYNVEEDEGPSPRESSRRSEEKTGCVNFPVNIPVYRNSREGGMFVRLVVEEDAQEPTLICSGGENHIMMDEYLVGTDDLQHKYPTWQDSRRETERQRLRHFPRLEDEHVTWESRERALNRYRSISYMAVLTLGSTGWSGYDDREPGGYWTCRYGDLTPEGRAMYDGLKATYPGARMTLQTWLDT